MTIRQPYLEPARRQLLLLLFLLQSGHESERLCRSGRIGFLRQARFGTRSHSTAGRGGLVGSSGPAGLRLHGPRRSFPTLGRRRFGRIWSKLNRFGSRLPAYGFACFLFHDAVRLCSSWLRRATWLGLVLVGEEVLEVLEATETRTGVFHHKISQDPPNAAEALTQDRAQEDVGPLTSKLVVHDLQNGPELEEAQLQVVLCQGGDLRQRLEGAVQEDREDGRVQRDVGPHLQAKAVQIWELLFDEPVLAVLQQRLELLEALAAALDVVDVLVVLERHLRPGEVIQLGVDGRAVEDLHQHEHELTLQRCGIRMGIHHVLGHVRGARQGVVIQQEGGHRLERQALRGDVLHLPQASVQALGLGLHEQAACGVRADLRDHFVAAELVAGPLHHKLRRVLQLLNDLQADVVVVVLVRRTFHAVPLEGLPTQIAHGVLRDHVEPGIVELLGIPIAEKLLQSQERIQRILAADRGNRTEHQALDLLPRHVRVDEIPLPIEAATARATAHLLRHQRRQQIAHLPVEYAAPERHVHPVCETMI
mmetsp:Transcript_14237/g.53491  ORF Transcript_14237/g.53491 Transcript_14237/m.53491 type:complete len:535 (+) Transcript_14237:2686-4290(+)